MDIVEHTTTADAVAFWLAWDAAVAALPGYQRRRYADSVLSLS